MSYEENKNNYLRSIGVADPENYDIQQDGRVTPRQAVAQEVAQEPSSWVDAAKSALYNAPRNVAGFVGGAGGAALAGLAGLPSGPGAIATGIGGALAGGFAGSAAGEALQNALYPQSWIDAEMARRARSPIATYVGGDVLPSLALMRPSARVLGEAGRGIKSLAGQAFNPGVRIPEAAALANVGIGAALGGGIEGGRQMVEGEFRPGRLAAETLLWAVSTEPTRLGRLLSGGVFRPTPLTRDYPTELAARMTGAGVQPPAAEPIQPNPLATLGRELGSRGSVKGARPGRVNIQDFPELARALGAMRKPKIAPVGESLAVLGSPLGERPAVRGASPGEVGFVDYPEFSVGTVPEPEPGMATFGQELGERPAVRGARPGRVSIVDFPETGKPTPPARKPKIAAAENPFFQEAEQTAPTRNIYDRPGAVEQQLQLDPNLPEAFLREFESFAAERLGAGVRQAPEIVMPGGGRARGSATPRTAPDQPAVIDIDVNRAARETLPHEALHTMEDTIGQYGNDKVKALWTQLRATVGKDFADANPEYVAKYGYDAAVTEGLAQRVGSRFIEYLGGKEPGMVRKLMTALRVRRGTASPAESVDFATHKLLRSAGTEGYESRVRNVGEKMGAMAGADERKPEEPVKRSSYTYEKPPVEKPVEQTAPVKTSSYIYEKPTQTKPVTETSPKPEAAPVAPAPAEASVEAAPRAAVGEVVEKAEPKYQPTGDEAQYPEFVSQLRTGYRQRIARGLSPDRALRASAEEAELNAINAPNIRTQVVAGKAVDNDALLRAVFEQDSNNWEPKYLPAGEGYADYLVPSKASVFSGLSGVAWNKGSAIPDFADAAAAVEYLRNEPDQVRRLLGEDAGLKWLAEAGKSRASGGQIDLAKVRALLGEPAPAPKYQPAPDEGSDIFSTEAAKEFRKPTPFNSLQPGKDGTFATRNVLDVLRTKLSPTENEMLYEPVAKVLAGKERVSRDEVLKAIDENVPRLEVKTLEAEQARVVDERVTAQIDNLEQQAARIRHKLDTEYPDYIYNYSRAAIDEGNGDTRATEFLELEKQRRDIHNKIAVLKSGGLVERNDSATRRYTQVNPRELKDMPGAVDLLVKVGGKKILPADATHYDKSGENALVHLRAYEHTMPDGEKVLRVFEVQSDWGQKRRKLESDWPEINDLDNLPAGASIRKQETMDGPEWFLSVGGEVRAQDAPEKLLDTYKVRRDVRLRKLPTHPLLPHSQRLALKAAIEHARKQGIKRIVVDDAETAMLTEGHDRAVAIARKYDGKIINTDTVPQEFGRIVSDYPIDNEPGELVGGGRWHMEGNKIVIDRDPFVGGMRTNYDTGLQKMMRDLSGAEGVRVELGVHKNAKTEYKVNEFNLRPDEIVSNEKIDALYKDLEKTYPRPEYEYRLYSDGDGDRVEIWRNNTREDLIFRDPSGQPKTTSTGFSYDVSAPQARRDAGEPFTTTRPKYQAADESMTFGPDAMRDGKPAEKTPITQKIRGFFAGESEKLRRRGGPFAYAADKIEQIYNNSRSMAADYYTPFETEALKLSADERNVLMTALYKADQTGKDLRSTLKPSLLPAYDAYRAMMKRSRKDQLAAGQRNVEGELPGEDPTYFGNVVSREMLQILHRKPGSEEYARARKEFVDYNTNRYVQRKGMPREAALKLAEAHFNKYVKQLTVDRGVEEAFSFGAVQLPAGSKLPPSWIEPDLLDATRRYMNRFAKDRAFYDVIRKDERASAALGLENYYDEAGNLVPVNDAIAREYEPVKGAQEVSHLLAGYVGAGKRTDDSFFPAVGRFINSLILAGPSTRAVDWLTTPFKAMAFVEPQHVPGLLKAVTFGIPEGMKSGVKTGLIKRNDMIVAREILGAGEELASKLDKATETIVKYTGTELLERYSRSSAQAAGEYIAKLHRAMAAQGNAKSKSFLSKFGPDAEKVDVTELGTRIAQLFQGKYDLTNLPKWAMDSQVAPFLSLMRWNVEQWNNFRKFVYAPAKEGNLTPALMTAVASVLGGLSIETLREQIMRKKSENASLKELLNAPDDEEAVKAAAAKLVASMQNTAMLGIVGEIGMYALNAVQGNNVRGFRFPTYEFAADVLGRGASAADAIMDGEDVVKVLTQYTADITTQHVQMARFVERMMAEYGLSEAASDKLKDMNARRDVRMFGKLSGLPKSQSPVKFSPYRKLSEKEFDEAKSVEEAREVLPKLKARAQERAGGDRRRLEEEMRTIRTIGGRVGPSPGANPQRFRDYVAYLRKTQGPAAAEEYRSEALKDERLRKAKARLVR